MRGGQNRIVQGPRMVLIVVMVMMRGKEAAGAEGSVVGEVRCRAEWVAEGG